MGGISQTGIEQPLQLTTFQPTSFQQLFYWLVFYYSNLFFLIYEGNLSFEYTVAGYAIKVIIDWEQLSGHYIKNAVNL